MVKCLPSMHEALFSPLHCVGLGMVVNTYNPSIQEAVELEEVQGHSHLYRELEVSLGYKRPQLKKQKTKTTTNQKQQQQKPGKQNPEEFNQISDLILGKAILMAPFYVLCNIYDLTRNPLNAYIIIVLSCYFRDTQSRLVWVIFCYILIL